MSTSERRSGRSRRAVEWLAGLAGAIPGGILGAILGNYYVLTRFGPYSDYNALLTLTVPAGMVAGAFAGQALARRVMDRRARSRREP